MKLTPEEKKAVQDSRDHWIRDIVEPLKAGRKIFVKEGTFTRLAWGSPTGKDVKYLANDCALCTLVGPDDDGDEPNCEACVYTKFYKKECNAEGDQSSHWIVFVMRPCLETAQAMVGALDAILKNQEV